MPPDCFETVFFPWFQVRQRAVFVRDLTQERRTASDLPLLDEAMLPTALPEARRVLCPGETERFPEVGRLAAAAMTEAIRLARP